MPASPPASQTPSARRPSVYSAPRLATPGVHLSPAEASFFVANGFFVKHGLLSATAIDGARDRIWTHLLDRVPRRTGAPLRRDDPATWVAPRWAPRPPTPKAGPHAGRRRIDYGGTAVKLHDLGSASYLLRLVPNDPALREVATALLGDLRPSQRSRGVYALFPNTASKHPDLGSALSPHTDRVCQQLNVCVYLDDVPPRSGGFTLYPGSHRTMFKAHRYHANWSPTQDYDTAIEQATTTTTPLEIAGAKGDAIFWHGRTIHSAGAHLGEGIRWAVFADYTHCRPTLSDDEHHAVGQYEWFKDAKLFREDAIVEVGDDAASEAMWRGWRLGGYEVEAAGKAETRNDLRLRPCHWVQPDREGP